MGGGEDLKNERFVREDVYTRIKTGINPLMQAAGLGHAAEILRELQRGEDVNASDETGWTALMIAAAISQRQSLLELVHGVLIKSRRNGSLVQPSTVPQPLVRIETDW